MIIKKLLFKQLTEEELKDLKHEESIASDEKIAQEVEFMY